MATDMGLINDFIQKEEQVKCPKRCGNCDWYDLTVPTSVVRKLRKGKGYKCSITGRGMFKDDGKKCKNHIFRSDQFCDQPK